MPARITAPRPALAGRAGSPGPGYWGPGYWGPGYWGPGYWGPGYWAAAKARSTSSVASTP